MGGPPDAMASRYRFCPIVPCASTLLHSITHFGTRYRLYHCEFMQKDRLAERFDNSTRGDRPIRAEHHVDQPIGRSTMLAETPSCFYRPTTTTRTCSSSSSSSTSGIKESMPYTNSDPDLMSLSASAAAAAAAGKSPATVGSVGSAAGVRKESMTSISSMPCETKSGSARQMQSISPAAPPATAAVLDEAIATGTASKECNTFTCCSSSADENNFDQQQPQAQMERMGSQLLPQTLQPSAASTSHTNGGIAKDAAASDNASILVTTSSSPASATFEAHRTLQTRGQAYPRAQHQFAFDAATPRSHWRRCNALSDNVAQYLAAHGLPADRAQRELTREYCQRYRFVRPVSEGAGGGAVFEIDTDWGRRVQVYEVDDDGWDEECADKSALFGGHARGRRQERMRRSAGATSTAAGTSSSQDPTTDPRDKSTTNDKNTITTTSNNKRKIHRRSQWEGRSFIASTLSSNGGLIERTERYLTSASSYLTTDERSSLPPSTDDTIQVVERTYSPEGDDVPPEIVTCREVFVRCYHHPTHRAGVRPDQADSGGPCCSIPVRSCPFEDVVGVGECDDAGSTSSSTIASFTRKDQVRVRTVLVPVENSARRQYRVCIEGDAVDLETRGLLGLLSDAVSDLSTAQDVLETLDVATICQRVGIAAAESRRCRILEASLRRIQNQILSLLG